MLGWILAFVYLLIMSAIQRWWDRNVSRTWRYDPVRKWRTSRATLFCKGWAILIPPVLIVTLMIGGNVLNAVVGAFVGMLVFTLFMEVGSRLLLGWWHDGDPGYQALIRDGFDPFWDLWLMGIVNRDPEEVRAGMPPLALRGSSWQAPTNWVNRCSCGAQQPGPIFWCWFCGRGYEHGCQKICCPDCDTTFCESEPGRAQQMRVTCPGCGTAWWFPGSRAQ
jgi:hypothetical protein